MASLDEIDMAVGFAEQLEQVERRLRRAADDVAAEARLVRGAATPSREQRGAQSYTGRAGAVVHTITTMLQNAHFDTLLTWAARADEARVWGTRAEDARAWATGPDAAAEK